MEGVSGAVPYPYSTNLRVIETLLVESRPCRAVVFDVRMCRGGRGPRKRI